MTTKHVRVEIKVHPGGFRCAHDCPHLAMLPFAGTYNKGCSLFNEELRHLEGNWQRHSECLGAEIKGTES